MGDRGKQISLLLEAVPQYLLGAIELFALLSL
jgi:hypothetical protein